MKEMCLAKRMTMWGLGLVLGELDGDTSGRVSMGRAVLVNCQSTATRQRQCQDRLVILVESRDMSTVPCTQSLCALTSVSFSQFAAFQTCTNCHVLLTIHLSFLDTTMS